MHPDGTVERPSRVSEPRWSLTMSRKGWTRVGPSGGWSEAIRTGRSVSWVMDYSTRPGDTLDRVGGVPSHLPYTWPRCQACQERMAFVGQLYASEWFPLDDHLALQFYVCDRCREERKWLHMEALPRGSPVNDRGA